MVSSEKVPKPNTHDKGEPDYPTASHLTEGYMEYSASVFVVQHPFTETDRSQWGGTNAPRRQLR